MPDGRGILLPCKAKKRRQYFVYCKIFQRGRPAKDPLRRCRMVVNTGSKVLLNFFQKIAGSRGRAPDALRTASRSEAFRAQPAEGKLLARDERGTHSPVKLRSGLRADALRRLAYARRCGGSFSGELPRSGKRGLFASEKAPLQKEIPNRF